jgi:hypothetical protein
MSSPELETLTQLLGGELPLATIRHLYPNDERFVRGLSRLLSVGQLRLLTADGLDVPSWQWHTLLVKGTILLELERFRVKLTARGVRRVS